MTEADWLAATDPTPMLEFLRGRASERKLRLFAVVCEREYIRFRPELHHGIAAQYANVTERYADGAASLQEWDRVRHCRLGAFHHTSSYTHALQGVHKATCCCYGNDESQREELTAIELAFLAMIVRDLFGNLFSPPHFDPSFRTSTVLALAAPMYASRDFTLMPMLADALQDAGCPDDSAVVRHCRGPGPHVRGCHVLDGILGKS